MKKVNVEVANGQESVTLDVSPAVRDAISSANRGLGFIRATNKAGKLYLFPAGFVAASRNIVQFSSEKNPCFCSLLGLSMDSLTEEQLQGYRQDYGRLKSLFATVCQIASAQRKQVDVQRMSVSKVRGENPLYRISETYLTPKPGLVMLQLCSAATKAIEAKKVAKALANGEVRAILDTAGHKSAAAQDRAEAKAKAMEMIAQAKAGIQPKPTIGKGKVSALAASLANGISKETLAKMKSKIPAGK